MNTETNKQPAPAAPKKGFFASLITRIDHAMKSAADKKSAGGCCCSGEMKPGGSSKGGKCC